MTARGFGGIGVLILLSAASASAQKTDPRPDALGRDTPRGTVIGFIAAARDGKDDIASQYLDSGLRGRAATELASKLYVVLNGRLPARLNELSDQPEGSRTNPFAPNRDVVGTIPTSGGDMDIAVERVTAQSGTRVWLFARTTLQSIPEVYNEIDLLSIDRYLPRFLTVRIAGIRLFEWLALLVLVPLLYRTLAAVDWLIRTGYARWRRRRDPGAVSRASTLMPRSLRLFVLALAIHLFVPNVDLPLVERQMWGIVAAAFAVAGVVGLMLQGIGGSEDYLLRRMQAGHLAESRALLRLLRRVAELLVVASGVVLMLHRLGIDPTAALAGLGIGGIAVALAAQKTLENVIGGFSLVFDNAIRVGDFLKLSDVTGTVDHIGLRSTRIRTLDRTIVTVPNGQIATASIETLSRRDKFWFHHTVGVRYETTGVQMRTVSENITALLLQQPRVDRESVRVRFFRLGPSSLDIEVFAYLYAADWERFLMVQQELLLHVMDIIEEAGTAIAFPSQTVHFAPDSLPTLNAAR